MCRRQACRDGSANRRSDGFSRPGDYKEACLLKFYKLYNHKGLVRNHQCPNGGGSASAKLCWLLEKGKQDLREMTLQIWGCSGGQELASATPGALAAG